MRGRLTKFDAETLNAFLEIPVVLEPGESYTTYTRFYRTRLDPQELASKLCIARRGFVLNAEGAPWKLLRKDLTTLA